MVHLPTDANRFFFQVNWNDHFHEILCISMCWSESLNACTKTFSLSFNHKTLAWSTNVNRIICISDERTMDSSGNVSYVHLFI